MENYEKLLVPYGTTPLTIEHVRNLILNCLKKRLIKEISFLNLDGTVDYVYVITNNSTKLVQFITSNRQREKDFFFKLDSNNNFYLYVPKFGAKKCKLESVTSFTKVAELILFFWSFIISEITSIYSDSIDGVKIIGNNQSEKLHLYSEFVKTFEY